MEAIRKVVLALGFGTAVVAGALALRAAHHWGGGGTAQGLAFTAVGILIAGLAIPRRSSTDSEAELSLRDVERRIIGRIGQLESRLDRISNDVAQARREISRALRDG